jgi:uncharacterized protein YkuJ
MRKGFIHVVEIIVIVLAMLFIMTQFSFIPRIGADFEKSAGFLVTNDLLYSLDAKGLDWLNATKVIHAFSAVIPPTKQFSVSIKNIIKPVIHVACICSTPETDVLRSLSNFSINDRNITLDITQIGYTTIQTVSESFSLKYDVILFGPASFGGGAADPTLAAYETRMRAFLRNGRGIVEVRNIDADNLDGIQNELFGVYRDVDREPGTDPLLFTHYMRNSSSISEPVYPNRTYFEIYKYYYGLPLFNESFSEGASRWTPAGGTWNVNPNEVYQVSCATGPCFSFAGNPLWDNYAIGARVRAPQEGRSAGIGFRQQTAGNGIWFIMNNSEDTSYFAYLSGGVWADISPRLNYAWTPGDWYTVRIEAPDLYTEDGSDLSDIYTAYVYDKNGEIVTRLSSFPDTGTFTAGHIGLYASGGATVRFDDIRVTPLEPERFPAFLTSEEKVGPRDANRNGMILMQDLHNATALIANSNVESGGRTAWLSAGEDDNPKKQALIRSILIWAAGTGVDVVKNEVSSPQTASFFKVLNKDYFEVFEVVLSIGTIF